ncbi:MAG: exodeoxyribonuclease VII small subunit [Candidatus Omnitrophota bacterium]
MNDVKYSKALKRLEEIIGKIENEEIDVDDLAGKVNEAVSLIRICKEKIEQAEMEVKKVVEDFEVDIDKEKEDGK